jgi:hypothetical protein
MYQGKYLTYSIKSPPEIESAEGTSADDMHIYL